MASIRRLPARLRAWWSLPAEIAAIREQLDATHRLLGQLNHEVHAGSEEALPLLQGYMERLRLDAETAIGATELIERQLAELDRMLATLRRND